MTAEFKQRSMKLHWSLLIAFNILLSDRVNSDSGSSVTTESLVKNDGYPYEEHECQTSDGYILTIHRIPYSARVNTSSPRPVAFLMHGLLASSCDWVILGPGNALAYILSDAGYDVWMGNARGNRFSRKHITLNSGSKSFWNFSFHEIGMIDLPNMIDYIRSHTNVDQVRYFGHSQGTTAFLLLNTLNSEFKSRIKSAHLLAPVAFINNLKSPFKAIGGILFGQPDPLIEIFGCFELLPNTKVQEVVANTLCQDGSLLQFVCSTLIFLLYGFDSKNLNTTMLPTIFSTLPAGASINQVYHYAQEINSGHFRQFDYGPIRNLRTYGSNEPPNYPLENIDLPIFLYYGKNDYFAAVKDVNRLIDRLSNTTLRGTYLVPFPKWNHIDFIYSKNVKDQVYNVLMEDVASIK